MKNGVITQYGLCVKGIEMTSETLNPVDPAFIACPFPVYEKLRSESPVTYLDYGQGFWFVTRHDLIVQAANDPETFSSNIGSLATATPTAELLEKMRAVAAEGIRNVPSLLTADKPLHTRNRRLVARAFTPRAVELHEPEIRQACRDLIAHWDVSKPIEFVSQFAIPLPVRIIARALGVPASRADDFKRWSDGAVALIGSDLSDEEVLAAMRANNELSHFIQSEIVERRAHPGGDDILSTLVHATLSDEEASDLEKGISKQLSDLEIVSIVRQLLVAGNETTTNLLTQMMVRFHSEPHWWKSMQDDPAIIPHVIEELLRLTTPSGVNRRRTTRPVELGGVLIPAGADVLLAYMSGNHDEQVFSCPEEFNPDRKNMRESLAFGKGIHLCVGAPLARLEAKVAAEELVKAIASYELLEPDHLAWNQTFMLRAIHKLPIKVTLL